MKPCIAVFLFFVLLFSTGRSQPADMEKLKKIDSLKAELVRIKADTSKVKLLNRISGSYFSIREFDESINYAADALELASALNYKKGIVRSYTFIGDAYDGKDDYAKAIEYYEKSLKICLENGFKKETAGNYGAMGAVYRSQGDYYKAKSYQLTALKLREELKDDNEIAKSLGSLGSVHLELGELSKALEYYLRALRLAEQSGNKKEIASNYNNIAVVYKSQSNPKKALEYYQKALTINEELNNKKYIAINISNMGGCLANLNDNDGALLYFKRAAEIREELNDRAGLSTTYLNMAMSLMNISKYDEALVFAEKSLTIRQEIEDKGGIASTLKTMGLIYSKKGDHKKGLECLKEAIEISKQIGSQLNLEYCYRNITEVYEMLNDHKTALVYHKLYADLRDTLLNSQSNKQIALMSTQFESEQKDNQIKLLNLEKEKEHALIEVERRKQTIIQIAGTCVLVLVLVISIIMFNAYRRKKRDNKEIKLQKEIIENKSKEVEASITYARRIQSAILPPDNFIANLLPSSFVLYQPKDIVSGDFYWVEKVGKKILIAVVDCTGHGVPGAMVSVVGNNALNRTIKEFKLTEPALILDKLNELVEETFEKSENEVKDGMDISLCALNPDTLELEWAGANNPIWILNSDGMKEIKGDKQPIGKFIHRKPFISHKIQLKKGDSFYLFSDGLADQFGGPKGKKFKYKQFMNLLIESRSMTKAQQKEILLKSLQAWKGNLEQIDDICVIGVEV